MKKIYLGLTALLLATVLIGCSSKQKLKLYIPNDYIDRGLIKQFEKENDVIVDTITFNSNEVALGQIRSNVYDVVIPSDYAVEELAKEGLIDKIDITDYLAEGFVETDTLKSFLTKLEEEGFKFMDYAVPYFYGTVGILYNHNVNGLEEQVKEEGFKVIADHKLETIIYDSSRDAFMAALNVINVLLKDATASDVITAREWLKNAKGPKTSILSDQILTTMLSGTKYDAVISYSGDAAYIIGENENYSFHTPENSNMWIDGMVIPTKSKEKELAKKFIKFMTSYQVAFDNSLYVGYTSPRKDVFEAMIKEDGEYSDERLYNAYNPVIESFQFFRYDNELKKLFDDAWEIVIAS